MKQGKGHVGRVVIETVRGRVVGGVRGPAGPRGSTRLVAATTVLVAGSAVLVAGCGGSTPTPLKADAEFVGVADPAWRDDTMAGASVRLAAQMIALGDGQDVVVSPASLQLALAVLREGADGEAADQLDDVLGLPESGSQAVADLRALLAEYDGDVAGIDPDEPPATPLLHVADAVFVQEGFDVRPEFLERAAAFHRSEVFEADFVGGAAGSVLDAWVREATGRLITEAPSEPSPDTRLTIMDAVTFGATWLHEFDPKDTWDRIFTLADGSEVQVPTMMTTLQTVYAESGGWQAAELPYTEGFVMRLAVADDAGSPDWFAIRDALEGASEGLVRVVVPTWKTDSTLDLTRAMAGMGLDAMMRSGDLEGVFEGAVVGSVAQGATITVAEKGTVAAAVTQVGLDVAAEPDAPERELILDHPFEYQVVHEATGLVLFAGRVADPSV